MNKSPYKNVKIDGEWIPEHRHIMQQHLGRELTKDEVVHHINGIKNDNRIENLQVMTKTDHGKLHGKMTKTPKKPKLKLLKLKSKRVWRNIKQQDMANQLGVTTAYLRKVEIGEVEPRRDFMKKCSEILNIDVIELFF